MSLKPSPGHKLEVRTLLNAKRGTKEHAKIMEEVPIAAAPRAAAGAPGAAKAPAGNDTTLETFVITAEITNYNYYELMEMEAEEFEDTSYGETEYSNSFAGDVQKHVPMQNERPDEHDVGSAAVSGNSDHEGHEAEEDAGTAADGSVAATTAALLHVKHQSMKQALRQLRLHAAKHR